MCEIAKLCYHKSLGMPCLGKKRKPAQPSEAEDEPTPPPADNESQNNSEAGVRSGDSVVTMQFLRLVLLSVSTAAPHFCHDTQL